jgi:hypothetical protein
VSTWTAGGTTNGGLSAWFGGYWAGNPWSLLKPVKFSEFDFFISETCLLPILAKENLVICH